MTTSADQIRAFERLKTLYGISKLLSNFESVEESCPKIFSLVEKSFPLLSAVIIEHWDKRPKTTIWHSEDATSAQIEQSVLSAKRSYMYLAGDNENIPDDFYNDLDFKNSLVRSPDTQKSDFFKNRNYIILPMIIDRLPPLGALQLEGASELDEHDLQFADAFVDLMSVAIDRYYKTRREREIQQDEARTNLKTLYHSLHKVENLETERELREAFVSLLTHDLRSPLSTILGSAQFILHKPNNDEIAQASARKIVKSVNRAGRMITDLLDANRIRSGEKLPVKKHLVEMSELIESTIADLCTIHGERFVFLSEGKMEVSVDENGIRRIIENLSSNAIKYGRANALVTITLSELDGHFSISIHNQGDPISESDQKSLFQQFRRTESAENSNAKGWGIGLTVVRGICDAHNGTVGIESHPGTGTIFTVKIPKK